MGAFLSQEANNGESMISDKPCKLPPDQTLRNFEKLEKVEIKSKGRSALSQGMILLNY